jgi:hypothetical protein
MSMNRKLIEIIKPYSDEPLHEGNPAALIEATRKVIERIVCENEKLKAELEAGK